MGIKYFFSFESKLRATTFQAEPIGLKINEDGISDCQNLIKGNYSGISFPVIFRQENGENLTDILDTGSVGLFLISDRLKICLEENKLSGWKIFPIKLFDKKGVEILDTTVSQ